MQTILLVIIFIALELFVFSVYNNVGAVCLVFGTVVFCAFIDLVEQGIKQGVLLLHSIYFPFDFSVAGPLALAKQYITSPHFFVLNSDVTCVYPFTELLKFHKSHGGEGTLVVSISTRRESVDSNFVGREMLIPLCDQSFVCQGECFYVLWSESVRAHIFVHIFQSTN